MESASKTIDMPPNEAFAISKYVTPIAEEHWEKFVVEELCLGKEKLKQIEEPFLTDKRLYVIIEWKKENNISDAPSRIKTLTEQFLKSCVSEKPMSPPSGDSKGVVSKIAYPKEHGKGCVLILINSFKWSKNKDINRKSAAEADRKLMEGLWSDTIHCDLFGGKAHIDKTAKEMKKLLKEMAAMEQNYDYLVVIISTHGGLWPEEVVAKHESDEKKRASLVERTSKNKGDADALKTSCLTEPKKAEIDKEGTSSTKWGYAEVSQEKMSKIYSKNYEAHKKAIKEVGAGSGKSMIEIFLGYDYHPVREREIKKYFYNDQTAPALHDVPKFFILDYCRGPFASSGIAREKAGPKPRGSDDTTNEPQSKRRKEEQDEDDEEEAEVTSLLPAVSDVLVAYATHPTYVAYEREASWLISTIAWIFKQEYQKLHAVEMLTLVNAKIKEDVGIVCDKNHRHIGECKRKAMSMFHSSLVKDLYFGQEN